MQYPVPCNEEDKYDVILLHDVIEHVPTKELFLVHLRKFLKNKRCAVCRISSMADAFWGTSTDLQKQTLLPSSIHSLVVKPFIQVVAKNMQWRERNNKWTYEHKRLPNKYRVVWKTHTPMWLFGNWPKTLVHQSSLQAEVPSYPTALASLGLESEVYQKFLHHFMLVWIKHR